MTEENKTANTEESPAQNIEELKKALAECEKLKSEYLAGWQRARADFINHKKEELDRIGGIIKFANAGFILTILPMLDNFNLAEKSLTEDLRQSDNIRGILQIKTQFEDFLESQGVEEIKSPSRKFDPNLQEVVEEIESPGAESGTVVEEIEKGYTIEGKLLRPAKVKVAK